MLILFTVSGFFSKFKGKQQDPMDTCVGHLYVTALSNGLGSLETFFYHLDGFKSDLNSVPSRCLTFRILQMCLSDTLVLKMIVMLILLFVSLLGIYSNGKVPLILLYGIKM